MNQQEIEELMEIEKSLTDGERAENKIYLEQYREAWETKDRNKWLEISNNIKLYDKKRTQKFFAEYRAIILPWCEDLAILPPRHNV